MADEKIIFSMNGVGKILPHNNRVILKDIYLSFFYGAKIGIIGLNGSGKSTLMKIIAGIETGYQGEVVWAPGYSVGYLEQEPQMDPDKTVLEVVQEGVQEVMDILKEYEEVNLRFCEPMSDDEMAALIERQGELTEKIENCGGWEIDSKLERAMDALQCPPSDAKVGTLSGGERRRVALCRLLLRQPDVLLLDEPTNHLDIESVGWLEDFIINSPMAVVVISHDRRFIDNITTRTIEVTMGRIYDYKANYSHYLELRRQRRQQQQKQFDDQQKQIAEAREFIERFKGTYSKTYQVQSKVKWLEKLDIVEVDEEDTSALRLRFPSCPRSGSYPVIADGVGKSYDGKPVFAGATFMIERGDKVAFAGRNGEGKSTMVKAIMQEIDFDGSLALGHNVQIGYFAQNSASLLDGELTVFQTIDDIAVGDVCLKIRDLLGAFMFGGEESQKKVKVLSGGERVRLCLIKLLLEPVNLLILDEPTNHLDLKTKDILKQALRDFDGTLILVSHDRDFLDGLVTKVYEFGDGRVREHICGINEFLENVKKRTEAEK